MHRIGPTPQISQPTGNSPEDVRALGRALFTDSTDLRAVIRDLVMALGYGAIKVNRNGSDQTGLTGAAFNLIDWTTKVFDPDNVFDLSNERYTPKIHGIYTFMGGVRSAAGTDGETCAMMVQLNGATEITEGTYTDGGPVAGSTTHQIVHGTVELNGNTDYIRAFVWLPSAVTTLHGSINETWFSAWLVRPL